MAASHKVVWLTKALCDLEEIVAYVSQDSEAAAEKLGRAILARADQLAASPFLGAVCPHQPTVRQIIQGKYIIYYSVRRREVLIRGVAHGARLFQNHWFRRR